MEQLEYNLLSRWFVGPGIDDSVWVATVFTKNRDRLLQGEVAQEFFEAVLAQGREHGLLSSEHFSVDGTLIEAWASQRSFRRKSGPDDGSDDDAGNPTVNFRGERRSNATHESTTDLDARLARKKGQTSHVAYMGHLLTENRNNVIVSAMLTQADGYAERMAALAMVEELPGERRITLGGDRGRGMLWLDEDDRPDAEDPTQRHGAGRMDVCLHGGGLQPGPVPQPGGGHVSDRSRPRSRARRSDRTQTHPKVLARNPAIRCSPAGTREISASC